MRNHHHGTSNPEDIAGEKHFANATEGEYSPKVFPQ
jgi:hypothetical protein